MIRIPEPRVEPPVEPAVWGCCAECGEPIYAGDYYAALGGETFCEACYRASLRCAEEGCA